MPDQLGVGVVGMGFMGRLISRSMLTVPVVFGQDTLSPRLIICADAFDSRLSDVKTTFGFGETTNSWRDVVDHPEVGAVVITTPNNLHVEIARAAAEAGKHVYCEKPVGRYPSETADVFDCVRRAGVISMVGYNYRWIPVVRHAAKLIKDGRIGEITHLRGRFFQGYGGDPAAMLTWRFREESSGLGTLADMMSHVIELTLMLGGPISDVAGNRKTFITERPLEIPGEGTHVSVRAEGPRGSVENEGYVGALVRFAGGAQGTLEACRVIKGPAAELILEVNGTEGAIRWNRERMHELEVYTEDRSDLTGYTQVFSSPEMPFHSYFHPLRGDGPGLKDLKVIEAYQFLKYVETNEQGESGVADALEVAEVQAAIMRSWESSRWEDVRPLI